MDFSQKSINNILTALFVFGAVFSIINLIQLPGALERVSIKIDLNVLEKIRPVIIKTLAIVGSTLLIGFILLISHFRAQVKKKVSEENSGKEISDTLTSEDEKHKDDALQSSLEKDLVAVKKKIEQVKGLEKKAVKYIAALCDCLEASQGLLYLAKKNKKVRYVEMLSGYAFTLAESETLKYEFGEGLVGQAAREGKVMNISDIPEGYIKILSGLGSATAGHLLIVPIKINSEVVAVVELASFKPFVDESEALIEQAFTSLDKDISGKAQKKPTERKKQETVKTSEKK